MRKGFVTVDERQIKVLRSLRLLFLGESLP